VEKGNGANEKRKRTYLLRKKFKGPISYLKGFLDAFYFVLVFHFTIQLKI
jgi:hypothetical protein